MKSYCYPPPIYRPIGGDVPIEDVLKVALDNDLFCCLDLIKSVLDLSIQYTMDGVALVYGGKDIMQKVAWRMPGSQKQWHLRDLKVVEIECKTRHELEVACQDIASLMKHGIEAVLLPFSFLDISDEAGMLRFTKHLERLRAEGNASGVKSAVVKIPEFKTYFDLSMAFAFSHVQQSTLVEPSDLLASMLADELIAKGLAKSIADSISKARKTGER